MRVLVTGGAGFIGANLLHEWSATHPEDSLTTLDSLTYAANLGSIQPLLDAGKVTLVRGDVADPAVVRKAVRDIDTVVHLAAESHVDRSIDAPALFVRTNVLGTLTLLEAVRDSRVQRFHHVSTDEVFGSLPLEALSRRFDDSTRYDPRSPYSASKASSDHFVSAFHHTYGLPTTISNCSNNYGPYQHVEKLIPKAITFLLQGKRVPIYGTGKNVRDWVHVRDHCRALDAIVRRGEPGRTYLVGARQERSNADVVSQIVRLLGLTGDWTEPVADRPGHDLRYALDPSTTEALGWKATVPFEAGLQETIEWYRTHPAWWKGTSAAPGPSAGRRRAAPSRAGSR